MSKKPDDFDFAEWFADGDVPEESHDVFTATHLVGEINALTRQIQEDDRARAVEVSLGEEASPDEERLAELLEEFLASKLTVFLKGLTPGERVAIRKAHEASGQPDTDFVERFVAGAIVGLKKPGQGRTTVHMSVPHVQKMHKQIGDGQMAELFKAAQQATGGVPTVDADFLLRRSGPENTEES